MDEQLYSSKGQYAVLGAYPSSETSERPYLARLMDIENQLAQSADLIEEFIARCRGGGVLNKVAGSAAPVATGHFAQIERVVEQMTRIDKMARELGTIG
jgi:hypothetical protein